MTNEELERLRRAESLLSSIKFLKETMQRISGCPANMLEIVSDRTILATRGCDKERLQTLLVAFFNTEINRLQKEFDEL